jgi:hypothetical protein
LVLLNPEELQTAIRICPPKNPSPLKIQIYTAVFLLYTEGGIIENLRAAFTNYVKISYYIIYTIHKGVIIWCAGIVIKEVLGVIMIVQNI